MVLWIWKKKFRDAKLSISILSMFFLYNNDGEEEGSQTTPVGTIISVESAHLPHVCKGFSKDSFSLHIAKMCT